ncbi:TetR/AcrR family transcriptional regulator [Roseomonas sp. OT10]|uniref:TetR/AcrR family transcriptional regulator n=1 Tax=Roseomonas cutis TaxID=2897332 RepID=UPI001E57EE20|nr:TetR/AcrR family transcriptional regulator [Roseomonas sp. OT10]UFN49953.1 TetR/AcrR family transcriptional regulator [Roseomonas sp. OT10]
MSSAEDDEAAPARPGPATGSPPRRRLPPAERLPQIREAAFAEFAASGYAAASMGRVAQRAGVAKSLLYHYFPGGKADLFKDAVHSVMQPVFEDAERLIAGFEGPRLALLERLIDHAYTVMVDDAREAVVTKLLIAEGERFPELGAFYRAEVMPRSLTLLRQVLQDGVSRREFRPEAAAWLPQLLVAPAVLASTWRLAFGRQEPLDVAALRRGHMEMLSHGLLAAPPRPAPG